MTNAAQVSVIIPCWNEVAYIDACLDSLLRSDYPQEHVEVLVVDGLSEDGTRTIIERYIKRYRRIRLLDNPRHVTPVALNIGIRAARGDVIMRMDAHVIYPPDYISRSVAALQETGADNVGGVLVTRPADDTAVARAIAAALAHPFGVGNAHFRTGVDEPRWVDTVPFGCYPREVFDRIGLFDEELVRDQDDEFNQRLLRHGGRLLLVPTIASEYYARASLEQLWRMYFQYGYFKPLVVRKLGGVLTARQLAPGLFVGILLLTGLLAPWLAVARPLVGLVLAGYAAADLAVATSIAWRVGGRVGLAATVVFPVLHVAYGLGYLLGVFDFLIRNRRRGPAVSLSR